MYTTIQKTIAAWAFNHYIAYYYFDNVNVSQLKVAFERGEVELENLPIKKDALQQFKLPMDVVSGVVGRLSIKVPLLTLLTDPWSIKIHELLLIVAPKKQTKAQDGASTMTPDSNATDLRKTTAETSNEVTKESLENLAATVLKTESKEHLVNETSLLNETGDQSQLDLVQESNEVNLTEYLDESLENVNSEETKLAEFYSSFSATVSDMVKDIYKNIRLEIESMTILFEDFDHGIVKFNVDSLLLHRPKSVRNLYMENLSIYMTSLEIPGTKEGEDFLHIYLEKCSLDIWDETSNSMQLVVVHQASNQSADTSSSSSNSTGTTSETKIEGTFNGVSIDHLTSSVRRGDKSSSVHNGHDRTKLGIPMSKRNILNCDTTKIEFKLSYNNDGDLLSLTEKNLHLKFDLVGMQYIHSQPIYELTTQRLMNLLKFFLIFSTKDQSTQSELMEKRKNLSDRSKNSLQKMQEVNFNKLLIINIEEGLLYVVDDTSNSCATPMLEFSLEDCRILQFSGKHQQNGFIFAKIGCNHYNREVSSWDNLLKPWPFNLTWDTQTLNETDIRGRKTQHRQVSLCSDEIAEFSISSSILDLGNKAVRRFIDNIIHPKFWPLARSLSSTEHPISQDFSNIFVLHNETGHKLQFAPLEHFNDIQSYRDNSRSPSFFGYCGGDIFDALCLNKSSNQSRSSTISRDSPDSCVSARWIPVDVGETISFDFETIPIFRRHVNELVTKSRILLIRVEGWKTLLPISLDKTGLFFREALSDRVLNEDTYIAVYVDLEEGSARKVISIRSPLNLINHLDTTLEVRFVESNQALYIKPDTHLAVPLPHLHDKMHIRPCNVGVSMSEETILWDDIKRIHEFESKIHICPPISVTHSKHASYTSSQPFRVCVSTKREVVQADDVLSDISSGYSVPVFSITFIPPLTIVNLLPCQIEHVIMNNEQVLKEGAQQKIYYVDTSKPTDVFFRMKGFPKSKAINIDPGATGSFQQTLEMIDTKNRSLYIRAKMVLSSFGEDPAVQVVVYAPYWIINKTRLPLVFKQEGAASEAAGQTWDHEEGPVKTLLFSFYDNELEPPWLCTMRLGKSKGESNWCEGFKLEKGNGERRLCYGPNAKDTKRSKYLMDINIRRGFGRYNDTMIVTFTTPYGFDPLLKTPKKLSVPSPQNYKLTSYNHSANLAERIAGRTVSLFNRHQARITSDINFKVPGVKITLYDDLREKLIEASVDDINLKCTTKAKEQIIDCSIQDIRIENVLPCCEREILLDRIPAMDESINTKPAVRLIMDRILGNSFGTTLFKQVQLSMCELALNLEEKVILKLVELISSTKHRGGKNMSNLAQDLEKIFNPEEDRREKYYFDLLRIDLSSLKLSVLTSTSLPNSLQKIKSYLGLKFFSFEDAQVQLSPYFKMSVSRTFRDVFNSVTRFYKRQILEQAPRIVGQQIQNYLRFHLSDLLSTLYDEVYNKLFN